MVETLVKDLLEGNQRALSRLITLAEREDQDIASVLGMVHHRTGRAFTIGITGPPGAGKSTIVDGLTAQARKANLTVGIIAADPSSPFTGGAVLGDRIRMHQHYLDPGVFIRSMATRGSLGGLPVTTTSVIKLMDAFGKDLIFVETVGVGQTELDVMRATDAVVVILVPEAGDGIQTMKAGLMEIADIFVVNKADRPGADTIVKELEMMLMMGWKDKSPDSWQVPVLTTHAHQGVGLDTLYQTLHQYRDAQAKNGQLSARRSKRRREEFFHFILSAFAGQVNALVHHDESLRERLAKVESGEEDACAAALNLMRNGRLLQGILAKLEVIPTAGPN